jgi:hypothetical protein
MRDLSLLNWNHSVFWAFAGAVSVIACVSTTERRIKAEVRQAGAAAALRAVRACAPCTRLMRRCTNVVPSQTERLQLQERKVQLLADMVR